MVPSIRRRLDPWPVLVRSGSALRADRRRKPVFFIFTPEEFQALLDSKKADSKGLRHFYISRAEAGMDRFVDWRDGGMDMTQYRGAFNKLEFNA